MCVCVNERVCHFVAPGNQVTHYYRNGTADECKGTWKNMFTCLRASMMDEEKRAVRLPDCLSSYGHDRPERH